METWDLSADLRAMAKTFARFLPRGGYVSLVQLREAQFEGDARVTFG